MEHEVIEGWTLVYAGTGVTATKGGWEVTTTGEAGIDRAVLRERVLARCREIDAAIARGVLPAERPAGWVPLSAPLEG